MPILIGLMLAIDMAVDVLQLDVSVGPGLSLKNAVLYLLAGVVALRMVTRRDSRFELPRLQIAFMLLIAYAIVTWLIAWRVIQYDNYPGIDNGILLKATLVDHYILFLVCVYGLRSAPEATTALSALLLVCAGANLLTVSDTLGVTHFGLIDVRDDGRVEGALGEANQYAGFLTFLIPMYAAAAFVARDFWRLVWLGCAALAMLAMLTTVSRGGFIALLGGACIGGYVFRRYISVGRIGSWAALGLALVVILLFAVSGTMRSLIVDRLFNESAHGGISNVSDGRSDIWVHTLSLFMDHPVTLITGYGWRAYWSMPHVKSPHNTYMNYWFNLGLPGLACLVYMLGAVWSTARSAALACADVRVRYLLIGFCFGLAGIYISIFFVEFYAPWRYLWAFFGIAMRLALAVSLNDLRGSADPAAIPKKASRPPTDAYGWRAARNSAGRV
jgi:O-antigen ligase